MEDEASIDCNSQYLRTALASLRERINALSNTPTSDRSIATFDFPDFDAALPPPLETLAAIFNLSPFEKGLLLLCAGVEYDAAFAAACGAFSGSSRDRAVTFELAAAVLPEAHWSAISPGGALRRWQLVEIELRSSVLSAAPLRLNPRIFFYMLGVNQSDERLDGLIREASARTNLAPSHLAIAEQIAALLQAQRHERWPVLQLCDVDGSAKKGIAQYACGRLGLRLLQLNARDIPSSPSDVAVLARLCDREMALSNGALLISIDGDSESGTVERAARFADLLNGLLFIAAPDPVVLERRARISFDVAKPNEAEQRTAWRHSLGPENPTSDHDLNALATTFKLDTEGIRMAAMLATQAEIDGEPQPRFERVWAACRTQSRRRLDGLAERLKTRARWNDLILPKSHLDTLHELKNHVGNRHRVFRDWGFDRKTSRGQGVAALFAGASGTGKTLGAEIIANELKRDLYRIDLSQVVSKYIGETEKNVSRIFAAAEDGGAVLLFDEADALFGKRSTVKDSHDRYANIEVSYLLQRMEAYRGLAILTTNLKSAIDTAFLRRLRFILQFPFPDQALRKAIWKRAFPSEAPMGQLDYAQLARLKVAGGVIHNIAVNAAFIAARNEVEVSMPVIMQAAGVEYAKLEKPMTRTEFGSVN